MSRAIRVGAVSYLNAKPLYHRLEGRSDVGRAGDGLAEPTGEPTGLGRPRRRLDPFRRVPPGGVERLRDFAGVRDCRPRARSGASSCSAGSRSTRIDRLALDEGSRTSQALTRESGSTPDTGSGPRGSKRLPMGVSALESTADAVLVIGDRAMKVPDAPFHSVVDLAEAWNELTGLPFVFALWVVRPGVDLGDLPEILQRCRAEGLARRPGAGRDPRAEAGAGSGRLLRLSDQRALLRPR